ncbi:TonB-dependent receptor [Litorimonas sp. RW-G-Af-16]|uniref:TonB-dependent receptor n=1 Tax=Litorimonas sp. RW-G-Af-16 TaxID=3241168 RepID=UPI00390CC59E
MHKNNLLTCSAIGVILAGGFAAPAYAQLQDEVIVTATKRSESASDIPIAVAALGEDTLDELNVNVFTDYLVQLPGVSAGGAGPGNNTIYIRGLASTTPATSIAGVAGLAPNVAFYLDEQPLAQPGRNLDVYAADLERVEVLSGPQGTLFGSSSQAGTVRMITNKPKIGVEEAALKFGTAFTKGGDMSFNAEAVYNVPVGENTALRGVVYFDSQGGYIDGVAGSRTAEASGRFRTADTVRSNGVVVGTARQGFQSAVNETGGSLDGVEFLSANAIVEENQNDAKYFGFRVSALHEFNDDWSLNVAYAHQELDTDGVFFADPNLDGLSIQSYEKSELDDDFDNVSWTLKGRLGALEALYTGAYTKRSADQRIDYSDYLFIAQYLPYYICDYSVYSGGATPTGTCQAPNLYGEIDSNLSVNTHELRFNTPSDKRLRATFGGFYSDLVLKERVNFAYPGNKFVRYGTDTVGFPDNFRFPGPGYSSDDTAFSEDTIFRNDTRRPDEQLGVFGEGTFDLSDQFALTVGARWYDIEVDLEGTANASFCNLFSQEDRNAFGTDINDLYDGDGVYAFTRDCGTDRPTFTLDDTVDEIRDALPANRQGQAERIFNELRAPDKAATDGVIFKVTGTWTPNDDMLFYGTYSQGFRPGLLNRPGGTPGANGFTVPFALDTDDVDNFEFGWKTTLADNQVRFNGSAFYVDVSKLQTTIFDPAISNLFFSDNAANAEIKGVEGDITYAPMSMEGLTVTGAFSFLDTEITEVLTPTEDVQAGDSLAFAPSFQGNLRARYEWETAGGLTAHVMPQIVHTSSSFSDIITINRDKIKGWTTLGMSVGLTGDQWMAEIYGTNLTNEKNELSRTYINDRERAAYGRPLTIGARFGYNF